MKIKTVFLDPNGIDRTPFYFTGQGTDFRHCKPDGTPLEEIDTSTMASRRSRMPYKRRSLANEVRVLSTHITKIKA